MQPSYELQKKIEAQKAYEAAQAAIAAAAAKKAAEEEAARQAAAAIAAAAEKARQEAAARALAIQQEAARQAAAAAERARLEAIAAANAAAEQARQRAAAEQAERDRIAAQQAAAAAAEAARVQQIYNTRAWIQANYLGGIPLYTSISSPVYSTRSIKLCHIATHNVLHSHSINYNRGSGQQEVTAWWNRDDNDWYQIFNDWESYNTISAGENVHFRHNLTGKYLYIDDWVSSPMTGQREASLRYWNGSNNHRFYFDMLNSTNGDNILRIGDIIRFMNRQTGLSLHSHGINLNFGSGQQEITGFQERDGNDYWTVIETS